MSNRSVQLRDPDNNKSANVDEFSSNLIMMGDIHAHIHEGILFSAGLADAALADNASLEILIQTAVGAPIHVRASAESEGNARAQLFENTTFSNAGAALPTINRNRRSVNVPNGTYTSAPTLTLDGDVLFDSFLIGGSAGKTFGGQIESFSEYILASGTSYLLRLQNISGQARVATVNIDFYDTGL